MSDARAGGGPDGCFLLTRAFRALTHPFKTSFSVLDLAFLFYVTFGAAAIGRNAWGVIRSGNSFPRLTVQEHPRPLFTAFRDGRKRPTAERQRKRVFVGTVSNASFTEKAIAAFGDFVSVGTSPRRRG